LLFYLSKLTAFLTTPGQLLLAGLLVSVLLQATRWWRAGRRLAWSLIIVLIVVGTLPLGPLLLAPLEARFPKPDPLPARIDGIVVLGGGERTWLSHVHGQPVLNERGERLLIAGLLARQHPQAHLLFTGGSAKLTAQPISEAEVARRVFAGMGLTEDRLLYEDRSRTTAENAVLAHALARPEAGQNWVLVTSAAHMPRAVGSFRQAGWTAIPYPVDFRGDDTLPYRPGFDLSAGLGLLDEALHEWLGLLVYWLAGRSSALFPMP